MKSYDPAFSLLALNCQMTYHPNNDNFPKTEDGFKQFVFLHPASTHPALHNWVTVGCIIHSMKMIKEIKNTKIKTTSLLEWLNKNCIYIKADSLGYKITHVVGYLLKLHPNITHQDSMKELIAEHLCHTPIKPKEAIALDNSTTEHYQCIMDSREDYKAFVPPFEVFLTSISSSPHDNWISTQTLGIRTSSKHQNLLRELLTSVFQNPVPEIAHIQFTLCSISTVMALITTQS